MMHKNQVWLAFLATIVLIVSWFSGVAGYKYYIYTSLEKKTVTTAIEWKIEPLTAQKYAYKASYTYQVGTKQYHKEETLHKPTFRNIWTAEEDLPFHTTKNWSVWYSPTTPDLCSLEKKFPLKECFSALALWALLGYFTWLGYYVSQYRPQLNDI